MASSGLIPQTSGTSQSVPNQSPAAAKSKVKLTDGVSWRAHRLLIG